MEDLLKEPGNWILFLILVLLVWRLWNRLDPRGRVEIVDERLVRPARSAISPPRSAIKEAEQLSGSYRLGELGKLLEQIARLEAWGVVVDLTFPRLSTRSQMLVDRERIDLLCESLERADTERFRQAASKVGLEARSAPSEGGYCIELTGTWSEIANKAQRMLVEFHGADEGESAEVLVFT